MRNRVYAERNLIIEQPVYIFPKRAENRTPVSIILGSSNLLFARGRQPNTIRVSSFESFQRFEALESKSNHFRRETSTNPFSPFRFPKGKADFQWQKSEVVVFGPSRPADVNTIGKSAVSLLCECPYTVESWYMLILVTSTRVLSIIDIYRCFVDEISMGAR
uniref:Uncharacterized protein n=1 Tax=Vespula pensylvanica TaxID=30213 RepID=A0A834NHU3_VESPE|nr:hypothetical protein H0235_013322 [Vespula pensylvanica]